MFRYDRDMRVYFVQRTNFYKAEDHFGHDIFHKAGTNALKRHMKLFESMEFIGVPCTDNHNYSTFLFKFDDPADEAFFLVWSSDGIEI